MRCAWMELMQVLPLGIRKTVEITYKDSLQELRLRLGQAPVAVTGRGCERLAGLVSKEDISFVCNTASRYSPWASATLSAGYITAPGGHRIGVCGEAVMRDGAGIGMRNLTSLCIRVARDFDGIGKNCPKEGNLLLLGPPGSGKTTLLRDIIRQRSQEGNGSIAVVDERGELFPQGFSRGENTDVLQGCSKVLGIEMALRTMGPRCVAVDEITAAADCIALSQAQWCGVGLLATVHAASVSDLKMRSVYKPLLQSGLFENILVLQRDKSWRLERCRV